VLHLVSHQNVFAACDKVFFLEAQVGVTVRLIHGLSPVEWVEAVDGLNYRHAYSS
jgi:hypothetical protein